MTDEESLSLSLAEQESDREWLLRRAEIEEEFVKNSYLGECGYFGFQMIIGNDVSTAELGDRCFDLLKQFLKEGRVE